MQRGKSYGHARCLRFERLEERRVLAVTLDLSSTAAIAPLLDSGSLPINTNVSNQPAAYQSEMTIDVNPINPLHLAGFMPTRPFDPNNPVLASDRSNMEIFQSFDGGKTWPTTAITTISGQVENIGPATLRGDPTIGFDAIGNLYIGYIHQLSVEGLEDANTVVVAKWDYANNVFTQFRVIASENGNGDVDKPVIATGWDPLSGNQAVYVAYRELTSGTLQQPGNARIMVRGSNNGGVSFEPAVQVSDISPDFQQLNFPDPAVGLSGELYVSWSNLITGELWIDSDLDGLFASGDNFGTISTPLDHD